MIISRLRVVVCYHFHRAVTVHPEELFVDGLRYIGFGKEALVSTISMWYKLGCGLHVLSVLKKISNEIVVQERNKRPLQHIIDIAIVRYLYYFKRITRLFHSQTMF